MTFEAGPVPGDKLFEIPESLRAQLCPMFHRVSWWRIDELLNQSELDFVNDPWSRKSHSVFVSVPAFFPGRLVFPDEGIPASWTASTWAGCPFFWKRTPGHAPASSEVHC